MQIDFKALEQALAPIEDIGQGEVTFDAGLTTITLRVILPHEEVEAQKHAAGALNEGDEGEHSAVDYLDRFRIACLSHALVAVGDQDFRHVDYVATGEFLANEKPIKVPRYKAMRILLGRWTRSTLTAVFARFSDLVHAAEIESEKQIEYEPSSIPAEIDRLQKRVEDLKSQVQQNEAAEKASFTEKVAALASEEAFDVIPAAPAVEDDGPLVDPEQVMSPVHRRTGPISPAVVPPPPERQIQEPQAPVRRTQTRPADSSFINVDDDSGLDAALDAEHNRIAEMRRRAMAGQQQLNDGSALQMIHPQLQQSVRRPPHLAAAEVEAEVGAIAEAAADARAKQIGFIDGKPVFALPGQDLDTRQPQRQPADKARLNPHQDGSGNRNPRFKAPQKP